jgi:hypothetical protein
MAKTACWLPMMILSNSPERIKMLMKDSTLRLSLANNALEKSPEGTHYRHYGEKISGLLQVSIWMVSSQSERHTEFPCAVFVA